MDKSFVMAVKSQDTILGIVQKEREEKMMITEEKKDPTEPEEKVVNVMKGGRTVNIIDSKRKKMKETDGMPSFNVLSQKN
jgi:hypothetical protein